MKKLYTLSLLASLFALSACSTTGDLYTENITINSMLPGAEIYIDGELKGTTPCRLELATNSIHEIEFKKEGFKNETYMLSSVPKESFVKLGPLDDTGYYRTLSPQNVYVEMKPDCLPVRVGDDAFESLTANYIKIDALKKEGKISQAEYDYIVSYMTKFYTKTL